MPKHHLFLVHGMGTHPIGWADGTIAVLEELYQHYDRLNDVPFRERIEIVPVTYDSRFEQLRESWKDASKLTKLLGDAGASGSLTKWA